MRASPASTGRPAARHRQRRGAASGGPSTSVTVLQHAGADLTDIVSPGDRRLGRRVRSALRRERRRDARVRPVGAWCSRAVRRRARRARRRGRHVDRRAARRSRACCSVRLPGGLDSRRARARPPTPARRGRRPRSRAASRSSTFSARRTGGTRARSRRTSTRAVERHQHRERVPVDDRRRTPRSATFRDATMSRCLEQLFNVVYRRELREGQEDRRAAEVGHHDIAPRRRHPSRRRGGRLPGHGRRRPEERHDADHRARLRRRARRHARSPGYSYTSDTDISAALQPAIVASVTRLQRAAPAA